MKNSYKFIVKNGSPFIFILPLVFLSLYIDDKSINWLNPKRIFYFGFILYLLILPVIRLQKLKSEYVINEITDEDLNKHQIRRYNSALSRDDVFERLKSDPWFSKQKLMLDEGAILIRTRWSMWGFGEVIRISPDQPFEATRTYTVNSKSNNASFASVDYGKNWEDVLRVRRILEQLS